MRISLSMMRCETQDVAKRLLSCMRFSQLDRSQPDTLLGFNEPGLSFQGLTKMLHGSLVVPRPQGVFAETIRGFWSQRIELRRFAIDQISQAVELRLLEGKGKRRRVLGRCATVTH